MMVLGVATILGACAASHHAVAPLAVIEPVSPPPPISNSVGSETNDFS